ncbi:MAG: hypothetical protein IPG76_00240 [Acidobacteria bacterium]|nr:hypothetical protein [Acidobacteriota bacterium]
MPKARKHFAGAIAKIDFYLTEDRPIEYKRERALQYGLTLDLLPHMLALLTYFGDVTKIDDISIVEAGRYQPLITADNRDNSIKMDISSWFDSETYSRVHFTFQDRSRTGFHIPCSAVVGKGFGSEVKYLQLTGISGHAIRIDLKSKPAGDNSNYPWDSIFFIQGDHPLHDSNLSVEVVNDPYQPNQLLKIIKDANFQRQLLRQRYKDLFLDLLYGTTTAVRSTLTLSQGQSIVRALDRIWWAIRIAKPEWKDFKLESGQSPFVPVDTFRPTSLPSFSGRRQSVSEEAGLIQPTRTLGAVTMIDESEGDDRPLEPVLTRGVRKLAPESQLTCQQVSTNDLANLLDELRSQVRGLPISLLAHNWKSKAASEFLSKILNRLLREDVVWLISPDHTPNDSLKIGAEKILDYSQSIEINMENTESETDRRVWRNLIADLVFFPAVSKEEVEYITKFNNRAQIVVIDELGFFYKEIQQEARTLGLIVYCWNEEAQSSSESISTTRPLSNRTVKSDNDMNKIGIVLGEIAEKISNKVNRRSVFKSRILEVMDDDAPSGKLGRRFSQTIASMAGLDSGMFAKTLYCAWITN